MFDVYLDRSIDTYVLIAYGALTHGYIFISSDFVVFSFFFFIGRLILAVHVVLVDIQEQLFRYINEFRLTFIFDYI